MARDDTAHGTVPDREETMMGLFKKSQDTTNALMAQQQAVMAQAMAHGRRSRNPAAQPGGLDPIAGVDIALYARIVKAIAPHRLRPVAAAGRARHRTVSTLPRGSRRTTVGTPTSERPSHRPGVKRRVPAAI